MSHRRFMWHEHSRGTKHVAERVIEKIEHSGSINVGVANDLGREESLTRSRTEETAHYSVR